MSIFIGFAANEDWGRAPTDEFSDRFLLLYEKEHSHSVSRSNASRSNGMA